MGGVLRPTGPHSARIYWRRRIVLVAVALAAVLTVWWVANGRSDAGANQHSMSAVTRTRTPQHTPGQGSAPRDTGGDGRASAGGHGSAPREVATPHSAGRPTSSQQHRAPPSGPCSPSGVSVQVRASDTATGRSTPIRLTFESLSVPACTLDVAPARIEVRVVSASGTVWSTTDCPDAFPAKQLVVRAGQPTAYVYRWNGHASVLGCHGIGSAAKPGSYWVEAALIGATPVRAPFTITPA